MRGGFGNALKGHFLRSTIVPVVTFFIDPSSKTRVFMKTINFKRECLILIYIDL
jgi:hypothetical protein